MRIALASSLIVSLCARVGAQEFNPQYKPIKLLGDETSLQKIKAAPTEFFDQPFIMAGGIRISDYYNHGYEKAQNSHYSLTFYQVVEPTTIGERCQLYLPRGVGKEIIDKIVAKSSNTNNKTFIRIRVKAVLKPERFEDGGWDLFELLDVQFSTPGSEDWEPWLVEARTKAAFEAAERMKLENAEAEQKHRQAEQRQRKKERLERTRTWTDQSGRFSVVAEYAGVGNGQVFLKKQDGKVIKVTIDKLSDTDRKWLDERREPKSQARPM